MACLMSIILRVVDEDVTALTNLGINFQVSDILCNCIHLGFHQLRFQALG